MTDRIFTQFFSLNQNKHLFTYTNFNFVKSKVKKIREIMIFHLKQEILDVWISSRKMNTICLFVQTPVIPEFDFGFIFPWKIHNWINGVWLYLFYFFYTADNFTEFFFMNYLQSFLMSWIWVELDVCFKEV